MSFPRLLSVVGVVPLTLLALPAHAQTDPADGGHAVPPTQAAAPAEPPAFTITASF